MACYGFRLPLQIQALNHGRVTSVDHRNLRQSRPGCSETETLLIREYRRRHDFLPISIEMGEDWAQRAESFSDDFANSICSSADLEVTVRRIVSWLLIIGFVSGSAAAFQGRSGGAAAGGARIKACAVLTKDLVLPFAQDPKLLDAIPPEEEPMAGGGAACEYGIVRLQISPGPGAKRSAPAKDWQSISGAGDLAYFRSNRDRYAELMFWTATHYLTLQVSVPTGSTAEAMKPKVITLANQVIAKLR